MPLTSCTAARILGTLFCSFPIALESRYKYDSALPVYIIGFLKPFILLTSIMPRRYQLQQEYRMLTPEVPSSSVVILSRQTWRDADVYGTPALLAFGDASCPCP